MMLVMVITTSTLQTRGDFPPVSLQAEIPVCESICVSRGCIQAG